MDKEADFREKELLNPGKQYSNGDAAMEYKPT
jgi:hypothetical protein